MSTTQARPESNPAGDELLAGVIARIGSWGALGVMRSAVELYGENGDPNDVLSDTQVEQLAALAKYFDQA
ncbi:hypothetical protein AQJ11_03015 [Streptomyces corchorusii]|uniref:Uncharacterized protein n=2 Tax=Streptomyces TaxID=1883 RepID=A0A101QM77_STRCK|nr:hypothetical protein [Streptomyces corchorusii]KUN32512.1 hypothetical protein AQJ11_03015 [Streptomyces corchorusii]